MIIDAYHTTPLIDPPTIAQALDWVSRHRWYWPLVVTHVAAWLKKSPFERRSKTMSQIFSTLLPYIGQATVGSTAHTLLKAAAPFLPLTPGEKKLIADDALWAEIVAAVATIGPEAIAAYKQIADIIAKASADLATA